MQRSILLLALVALLAAVASADNRGLSTHFSADTKAAFKATLASAQPFTSLESAALGVSALKRLGESVAHKADLCSLASSELSSDKPQSVEAIFYASELRQALACTGGAKQASKAVADVLRNAIDEASSLSNLLHASKALLTLNKAALLPPNSFTPADLSVVIAHVAEAFASELPIEAYGHGFAAAALAAANSNSRSETDETSFDLIAEAVGDVLGRGIELEDGSVVFYDSGDSSTAARTTAALLSGIASLAAAKPDIELPSVRPLSLSLSLSLSLLLACKSSSYVPSLPNRTFRRRLAITLCRVRFRPTSPILRTSSRSSTSSLAPILPTRWRSRLRNDLSRAVPRRTFAYAAAAAAALLLVSHDSLALANRLRSLISGAPR